VLTANGEGGALDASLLPDGNLINLNLEALALQVAQVHAQHHLCPVLSINSPGTGVNGNDGIVLVVLPRIKASLLQVAHCFRKPLELLGGIVEGRGVSLLCRHLY